MAKQANPQNWMAENVSPSLRKAFKEEFLRYSDGDSVAYHCGFYNVSVLEMLKETVEKDSEE